MQKMRGGKKCRSAEAIRWGSQGFVRVRDLVRAGGCQGSAESAAAAAGFRWRPGLLGPRCSLFGRKVPAATAEAVRALDLAAAAAERPRAAEAPAPAQADGMRERT